MWLMPLNSEPQPSFQLYCFPYGGAGPSIYKKWAPDIGPGIELIGIQLPGRETRIKEPGFTSMKALVNSLMNIWPETNPVPYAFFGHSLGSLVAYELALEIGRKKFQPPIALFISGSKAPHLCKHPKPIHQLPDQLFLEAIRQLGGTPEAVLQNELLMNVFLPVLRADFTLFENYTYQQSPLLDLPLLACCGDQDQEVSVEDVEAWKEHTTGEFQLKTFAGDHFYLEQHHQKIIQYFSSFLFKNHYT